MGCKYSIGDCQLKFVVNQYSNSDTTVIADIIDNESIELILPKTLPDYSKYLKYIRDQSWVNGEYTYSYNGKRIIKELYPSLKQKHLLIDEVFNISDDCQLITATGNNDVYYCDPKYDIFPNKKYRVKYEFKNKGRIITDIEPY
jgi:hypothetical protein